MKKLKLGFIGGGINSAAGRAHLTACRMDGLFEVVAGCYSRDSTINGFTAAQYGTAAWFSPHDLLADDIDAVVVLSPTPDHFEHVRAALMAGIPVICEKALASTHMDVVTLAALADHHAAPLMVMYNYTGYPMVRELRDMVLDGELGRIVSIQIEMPQEGYLRGAAQPQAWRLHDGPIPAVHLDLGTHLHHMVDFFTGKKARRLVASHQSVSEFNVVDDVNCMAVYDDEMRVNFWFGKAALGHRNGLRVRVYGTEASAEWFQMRPEELRLSHNDGRVETVDRSSPSAIIASAAYSRFKPGHPVGFVEAYANVYQTMHSMLTGMRPLYADAYSPQVACEGLAFMEAMVKSAKEQSWVVL